MRTFSRRLSSENNSRQGLVRLVTLHVTQGLLLVILATALLSVIATWLLTKERQANELALKADFVGQQFEGKLNGFASALSGLASNRLMANALLDSQGRDRYLRPFMREFDFRIDEVLGLTLCDYLCRPLATSGVGDALCFADTPHFASQMESRQAKAFTMRSGERVLLVLFQPVIYPTTNTGEGMLVGILDLSAWTDSGRHTPIGYKMRLVAEQENERVRNFV